MFSRRHPYLFFLLIIASIFSVSLIGLSLIFFFAGKDSDYSGLNKSSGEKVGIIEINGVINESKDVLDKLKRLRADNSIKAIVVRINSPGGSVGPAQEIFREIKKTALKKKIVASLGAVAASGGYYVAAGTEGIIANPGTITGSIGVVMGFTNFQELLQKIGLNPVVIKSGSYKDIGSPVRKMTEKERQILQDLSDQIHRQFISAIAEGRKMDLRKVESIADGRIFSGEEARKLGLVDRLGNLEDAVEWAGRMGGIKGKIKSVYIKDKRLPFLQYLTESALNNIFNMVSKRYLYADFMMQPI
ncbi:MAG: signal peptide peptidase SppA [Deltaproteobacteria bacterium]|nr:signal peptide peptidase SppA [Deltaproteobacteria bacterium]